MRGREIIKRNYDDEGNLISKECSCCHEVKPVSEFNKSKTAIDGLQLKCKECLKKYRQENKNRIKGEKNIIKRNYNDEGILISKECSCCHKIKSISEFNKNKSKADGLQLKCKECLKKYRQENGERKKEYMKIYNQEYKEELYEKNREYYQKNKNEIIEYKQEYRQKNTQEALQQIKIEVEKEPEKYNYIEGKDIYGIIYLVHNIKSDKYYVGQTTRSFDIRYNKGWLYEHSYKDTVKHDLKLYGENSFEYVKLFKVGYSQYELDKLEAYYINYYDSYENGYNENRGNIFTDRGKEK